MKTFTEDVIVKDFGKQGLAIFVPCDPANLGRICVYDCYVSYDGQPRGFRPDMVDDIVGYSEADMGYYYKARNPKKDDPRVGPFMERYRQFAEAAYTEQPCKLVLRRVFKDQQRYRAERWKR